MNTLAIGGWGGGGWGYDPCHRDANGSQAADPTDATLHPSIDPFIYSFIHSSIHWTIHPSIHSFIDSFAPSRRRTAIQLNSSFELAAPIWNPPSRKHRDRDSDRVNPMLIHHFRRITRRPLNCWGSSASFPNVNTLTLVTAAFLWPISSLERPTHDFWVQLNS